MPSKAPTLKAALVDTILPALYPSLVADGELLISYGMPGSDQPDQVIGVMDMHVVVTRPVHGPLRTKEETIEATIIFSVWVPGDQASQRDATEQAFTLLGTFEDYFKQQGSETPGGAYDAYVSSYDYAENVTADANDQNVVTGRVTDLTAVLTVKTRI